DWVILLGTAQSDQGEEMLLIFRLSLDLDEIEEVNANCILMANLQQALTLGTQIDKAPVYDSDGSVEIHKIVKDEIFPIVNQVDAIVQNFKIQFLKEATKFVRDFKSLAKEADEFLAKYKALELEIECLLRAVVSQDIMSTVQINYVVDTSNLQTELEHTKERFENYNLDPLSQKLENENVKLEFQVLNYAKENAHLKTTYKNLFDSIKVTRAQTKTIIDSLQDKLHDTIYENAKLRAQLFDKVSEQKDTTKGVDNTTKTRRPQPRSNTKNDRVIQICLWCVDSGCSKHMTGNLKLLINFVWKFLGTVRFGNDHVAAILGFGDLQWGNLLITRVYSFRAWGTICSQLGSFVIQI
ncbi:hypothetical protein Tco_1383561, partial [Tanacetum coccineum]